MTEVDEWGTWEVDGPIRTLIEPSQAWYDARDAEPMPEPAPSPEERIAELEAQLAALLGEETP